MSVNDLLSKHERRIGYLKMTIALGLNPEDRDEADELLHPTERTGVGVYVTLAQGPQNFIDDYPR